jgi:hypothetical protein
MAARIGLHTSMRDSMKRYTNTARPPLRDRVGTPNFLAQPMGHFAIGARNI